MAGVIGGLLIIAAIVAIGFFLGKRRLLADNAQDVLNRLSYLVLSPVLFFTVVAESDVARLFGAMLPVAVISAVAVIALFLIYARLRRRDLANSVIGAMGSGYVNAGNMGIPVAMFILGDAEATAPIILFQLLVLNPAVLALLDYSVARKPSIGRLIVQPVRNPLFIGSVLGLLVALLGVELREVLRDGLDLVAGGAIPVILICFGIALASGPRVLQQASTRQDTIVASLLKLVAMPLVAWGVGAAGGLVGQELFAVVLLAALPSAQNVYSFAQLYGTAVPLGRDTVAVTSVAAAPVLVLISVLLGS